MIRGWHENPGEIFVATVKLQETFTLRLVNLEDKSNAAKHSVK